MQPKLCWTSKNGQNQLSCILIMTAICYHHRRLRKNLGFTNMDTADIRPIFLNKKFNQDFERKAVGYGRVTYKTGG
jgi:hypothetical protein